MHSLGSNSPRQATNNAFSEKGIGDPEISEALTMLEIFRKKEIAMCLDRSRDDQ
jgi:hypothetical protein